MGVWPKRPSDQNEIDERKQCTADGHGDDGIIGTDVRMRARQWLNGFLSHFDDLGQGDELLCEADHIPGTFFLALITGNEGAALGVVLQRIFGMRSGKVMSQQLPTWRTANGQTAWLSRLIDAMEKFSRPEWRARPVDPLELRAIHARLAQPAMLHRAYGSRFSLRN